MTDVEIKAVIRTWRLNGISWDTVITRLIELQEFSSRQEVERYLREERLY